MKKYITSNNEGGALAVVIIVMAVLTILGTVTLRVAVAETNFAVNQENKLQAYYLARSGAQSVAEYMVRDANEDAHEIIDKDSEWNEQLSGGKFMVEVSSIPSSNDIDIISTGEYEGVQQKVKIRVTGSSVGIGGIFQYAIAAKNGISTDSESGQNIVITGSVATKSGNINLGNHGEVTGEKIYDSNLIFPVIELPPDRNPSIAYDLNLGTVNLTGSSDTMTVNTSSTKPLYVSANSITLKNSSFNVTGNGVAHIYVQGNLNLDTNSNFEVASTAKLFVYVVGDRNVTFSGAGAQNNLFIYAPDSHIEWNNAGAGDFLGSLIGETVMIHNKTHIKFNPDMANDVELDVTGSGVTYTGYIWID